MSKWLYLKILLTVVYDGSSNVVVLNLASREVVATQENAEVFIKLGLHVVFDSNAKLAGSGGRSKDTSVTQCSVVLTSCSRCA